MLLTRQERQKDQFFDQHFSPKPSDWQILLGKEESSEHKLLRVRNISLNVPKCRSIEEQEEIKIPQRTKTHKEHESKERQDHSKSMFDNSIDYSDVHIKEVAMDAELNIGNSKQGQGPLSSKISFNDLIGKKLKPLIPNH